MDWRGEFVVRCTRRVDESKIVGDDLDSTHLVSTRLDSTGLDSSRPISGCVEGITCEIVSSTRIIILQTLDDGVILLHFVLDLRLVFQLGFEVNLN